MDNRRQQAQHRMMTLTPGRYDRLTTRMAELDSIRSVLAVAAERLDDDGWIQDEWAGDGGVCLVSAIRAGSVGQLRARAIDVCWHARYGDGPVGAYGVGRVPPPAVRMARVRDLTRWNDHPGRRVGDVIGLLVAAQALAAAEMERLRAVLGLVGVEQQAGRRASQPVALTP